jgi:hypothetical protein
MALTHLLCINMLLFEIIVSTELDSSASASLKKTSCTKLVAAVGLLPGT